MKIILIGSGTLLKLIIDILKYQPEINICGIYDDTIFKGNTVNGFEILGKIEEAFNSPIKNVVICIGNQKIKKELFNKFQSNNFNLPTIIAHNAIISDNAIVENGCIIGFNSTVLFDSKVEKGTCILNTVSINHNTLIKEFCLIGVGVLIGNDTVLEEGVHVAMGQTILPSTIIKEWEYIH